MRVGGSYLATFPVAHSQFEFHKCVSVGYTPKMATKDVGLRIRVERSLRKRFVEACQSDDKPAPQVIREFIRDYVGRHPSVRPARSQGIRKKGNTQSEGKREQ